nr:hypothetical protein GCM10020185_83560 [Pseudomonas brassicacearum subsp. brassicacearum]
MGCRPGPGVQALFFYTRILPDLRKRGKLLIVISHDDAYFGLADRLIRIEHGKLSEVAPQADAMPVAEMLS